MAQFHLGQKVRLIGLPPHHHLSWPVGTTGSISKLPQPSLGFSIFDRLMRPDWYRVEPDQPQNLCGCTDFSAPASCLAPIQYDGYEPQQLDKQFDFTDEEELETVS